MPAMSHGVPRSRVPIGGRAIAGDGLHPDEHPRAANAAIANQRDQLAQPPFRNVAAFLSAYCRVRSTADRSQSQRERRELKRAAVCFSGEVPER